MRFHHFLTNLQTSNMAEETGFNPETYTHVLPEGQEDFQDFTEADLQQKSRVGIH